MAKPGVMIYFDVEPILKRLNDHQAAQLFRAIIEYGHIGETDVSDFDDITLVIWELLKPRIDADNIKYQNITKKRSEAGIKSHQTASNVSTCRQMPTNADKCRQMQPTDSDFISPTYSHSHSDFDSDSISHDSNSLPSYESIRAYIKDNGLNVTDEEVSDLVNKYSPYNWKYADGNPVDWKRQLNAISKRKKGIANYSTTTAEELLRLDSLL